MLHQERGRQQRGARSRQESRLYDHGFIRSNRWYWRSAQHCRPKRHARQRDETDDEDAETRRCTLHAATGQRASGLQKCGRALLLRTFGWGAAPRDGREAHARRRRMRWRLVQHIILLEDRLPEDAVRSTVARLHLKLRVDSIRTTKAILAAAVGCTLSPCVTRRGQCEQHWCVVAANLPAQGELERREAIEVDGGTIGAIPEAVSDWWRRITQRVRKGTDDCLVCAPSDNQVGRSRIDNVLGIACGARVGRRRAIVIPQQWPTSSNPHSYQIAPPPLVADYLGKLQRAVEVRRLGTPNVKGAAATSSADCIVCAALQPKHARNRGIRSKERIHEQHRCV
mmetsp:Transcript_69963/g.192033  ORF Transcript_69963/g.192033 Transcript_69963/m.192033 type:complete len:340 (-) Transcript_69963:508-1527(-)